jgi:hypothetical protein
MALRHKATGITPDQQWSLRVWLGRFTVIDRAEFSNLTPAQQEQFLALAEKVDAVDGLNQGGFALDRLTKAEKKKFIFLLERLGGLEPGTFEKQEEEQRTLAQFAELARLATMPARRVRYEEPGSVRLPAAIYRAFINQGGRSQFRIATLGLLSYILLVLENGASAEAHTRVEGTGDDAAFVIDPQWGCQHFGEDVADWKKRLEHLDKIGWLRVEKRGREWRAYRGRKALAAANAGKAEA